MRRLRPILIVEDDQVDVLTVKRALHEVNCPNPLEVRRNGAEALEYLRSGESRSNPPCLALLDLNMPRMNGIEFLQALDNERDLKKFPVVVVSTSNQDSDVVDTFRFGVAGYMVKPVDYKQFVAILEKIESYWSASLIPE